MDCLYLVHNGVPFDVAFSLDTPDRLEWVAVIGRLHGQEFDWSARRWLPAE